MKNITITSCGGNCPVQIEGIVGSDKNPFYFRARHGNWSVGVGEEPIVTPEWFKTGKSINAGLMSEDQATKIVTDVLSEWLAAHEPYNATPLIIISLLSLISLGSSLFITSIWAYALFIIPNCLLMFWEWMKRH